MNSHPKDVARKHHARHRGDRVQTAEHGSDDRHDLRDATWDQILAALVRRGGFESGLYRDKPRRD